MQDEILDDLDQKSFDLRTPFVKKVEVGLFLYGLATLALNVAFFLDSFFLPGFRELAVILSFLGISLFLLSPSIYILFWWKWVKLRAFDPNARKPALLRLFQLINGLKVLLLILLTLYAMGFSFMIRDYTVLIWIGVTILLALYTFLLGYYIRYTNRVVREVE